MVQIAVQVNGTGHTNEVEPRLLLVQYLREVVGLTGTNIGCDTTSCGACTVLLDGESVKSCTVLAAQADGADITTIEGLADGDGTLHPMQEAFREHHGLQCGYCTPGMVMAAVSLLDEEPRARRAPRCARARRQPLPLHRLPQHREGSARVRCRPRHAVEGGHDPRGVRLRPRRLGRRSGRARSPSTATTPSCSPAVTRSCR